MLLVRFLVLVFCILFLRPNVAFALEKTPSSAELLTSIARAQSAITRFYAPFVQEKHMRILTRPLLSEGYMCVTRAHDSNVLWAYTKPVSAGFSFINGEALLFDDDPLHGRATNPAEAKVTQAIVDTIRVWMHVQPAMLEKAYDLTQTGARSLAVTPKRATFFTRLELRFSPDFRAVEELIFREKSGDVLSLRFSYPTINEALPAACSALERK